MAALVSSLDWSATPLGPMEAWPERLKLMVEQVLACPVVSALVCGPERILIYNDAAARNYGNRHPGALGKPLPETFPEGWASVGPLYERAFAGESVHVPAQGLDVDGGGRTSTFDAVLTPVHDGDGRIAYVHMNGRAVLERDGRRAETLEILVTELRHRARNSYTLIQSIANETARESGAADGFLASFSERLASLARVQDLLSLRDDESVSVRDLVERELEALGSARGEDRVEVDGPYVPLRRGAVEALALVVHELATNARKYGALADGDGRLSVRWSVADPDGRERLLRIEWTEGGGNERDRRGSGMRAPDGGGYGRKLIERALPSMLGASTLYEIGTGGVRCVMEIPIAATEAENGEERPGAGPVTNEASAQSV
ncbi:sensor histidine kinase [Antarcticirhabdus aurantiaca]|uniref:PAS domain-containing protein n=1 Tax=Antarcticirhabdus aurantiaca TaxID=2606717 RepID=A0ACD4NRM8_9HYPH|nr:PAS domain-containing sensor histidine kinase [Antarcticirhabdus aurantiaca]WAJ29484.1 PAS domain-containing protein [Jeongeuplla avenae]